MPGARSLWGKSALPTFPELQLKSTQIQRVGQQERRENSGKVHFIDVERNLLLLSEMTLRPHWKEF